MLFLLLLTLIRKGKHISNVKLAFICHKTSKILTTILLGRRVKDHDQNVHNLCVQNKVGRVGGEANLVNDNKCRVFFSETTP